MLDDYARLRPLKAAAELLARRWRIEELTIERAKSGIRRDNPGRSLGDRPIEAPEPAPEGPEGTKIVTLDDLLASAEEWETRLGRVRDLIDWIVGDPESEETFEDPAPVSPLRMVNPLNRPA